MPRLIALIVITTVAALASDVPGPVGPPPARLVESLRLNPFYRKHVDAHGLPVLASDKVNDYALEEGAYLVDRMLESRPDVRDAMIKSRVRVVVMATTEMTTAVPEHSDLTPAKYWDKRARGLGASRSRPAVSCGEENLLEYPGDPYAGENILVHEFAHAIHEMGLRNVEPDFDARLRTIYKEAMAKGLWKGAYSTTNPGEYWAEGVQSWFDCNQAPNHSHIGIRTREQLETYDPALAALIADTFRKTPWRYVRPSERKDKGHLSGYDSTKAPRFQWDPALVEWYRKYEREQKRGRP